MSVPIAKAPTKVSELPRDIPSDKDLILLQKRDDGQTFVAIAKELGIGGDVLRKRFMKTRVLLRKNLGIEIDQPELFPRD